MIRDFAAHHCQRGRRVLILLADDHPGNHTVVDRRSTVRQAVLGILPISQRRVGIDRHRAAALSNGVSIRSCVVDLSVLRYGHRAAADG